MRTFMKFGARKRRPLGERLSSANCKNLFDFHSRADFLESSNDLVALFLGDAFLEGLGRAVHQLLGFLEACLLYTSRCV